VLSFFLTRYTQKSLSFSWHLFWLFRTAFADWLNMTFTSVAFFSLPSLSPDTASGEFNFSYCHLQFCNSGVRRPEGSGVKGGNLSKKFRVYRLTLHQGDFNFSYCHLQFCNSSTCPKILFFINWHESFLCRFFRIYRLTLHQGEFNVSYCHLQFRSSSTYPKIIFFIIWH
jgi:hypothetical protein